MRCIVNQLEHERFKIVFADMSLDDLLNFILALTDYPEDPMKNAFAEGVRKSIKRTFYEAFREDNKRVEIVGVGLATNEEVTRVQEKIKKQLENKGENSCPMSPQ